jgi:hypothetical protein
MAALPSSAWESGWYRAEIWRITIPRNAKDALNGARFTETVHVNPLFPRGKALDRQNGFPLEAGELLHAGFNFLVNEHVQATQGHPRCNRLGGGQNESVSRRNERRVTSSSD